MCTNHVYVLYIHIIHIFVDGFRLPTCQSLFKRSGPHRFLGSSGLWSPRPMPLTHSRPILEPTPCEVVQLPHGLPGNSQLRLELFKKNVFGVFDQPKWNFEYTLK